MVKVMIADDHALIRRIVREVVEKESDLELIAEARDGNEAEEQATHTTRCYTDGLEHAWVQWL